MAVAIEPAKKNDRPAIQSFYRRCGYSGTVDPDDTILTARENAEVIGAVRLVDEHNILVLRGMYISQDRQRRGIGSRLLFALERPIGNRECYCIPYKHLENFYEKIGFSKINENQAPTHLQTRIAKYRALKKEFIIMRRSAAKV